MNRQAYSTRKKFFTRILLLLCTSYLTSCGKPVFVDISNACKNGNNNQYIAVEGYLRTGTTVLCSSREGTRSCGLELTDKPDGDSKLDVYVEVGTGKSQMDQLPKNYGKNDLRIRDKDGRALSAQDRVRVLGVAKHGDAVVNNSYAICYVNVQKIERP
jgi:hypothetical protein